MKRIFHKIVLCASAFALGAGAAYGLDGDQAVKEMVDKLKNQSSSPQPEGVDVKSVPGPPQPTASTPESCPEPTALDLFKYQIVFEKTGGTGTLNGLEVIHADVWERGVSTAFYVRERLPEFTTNVRMAYLFDKDGMEGGGTCPAQQNWMECAEKADRLAGMESVGSTIRTCTATIDLRALPAWEPTPDSLVKRRLADHLRSEIEAKWAGVQEIVIKDFNLNDPQISIYLKMPDGEYFQGCALHALREPHCDGWHLFGQAPVESIRKSIFEKPYRLK